MIAFGQDGEKLARALGLPFDVVPFAGQTGEATMQEALRLATAQLDNEGTVLLSPIGTSFDLYRDYAQRGAVFTAAARALTDVATPPPRTDSEVSV